MRQSKTGKASLALRESQSRGATAKNFLFQVLHVQRILQYSYHCSILSSQSLPRLRLVKLSLTCWRFYNMM